MRPAHEAQLRWPQSTGGPCVGHSGQGLPLQPPSLSGLLPGRQRSGTGRPQRTASSRTALLSSPLQQASSSPLQRASSSPLRGAPLSVSVVRATGQRWGTCDRRAGRPLDAGRCWSEAAGPAGVGPAGWERRWSLLGPPPPRLLNQHTSETRCLTTALGLGAGSGTRVRDGLDRDGLDRGRSEPGTNWTGARYEPGTDWIGAGLCQDGLDKWTG